MTERVPAVSQLTPGHRLDEMSHLQRAILAGRATGLSNRTIAARLDISTRAVGDEMAELRERLQVHSDVQVVVQAVREGFV